MKKRYIPAQLVFFVLLLFGSSTFAQQEKEWLTVDRYLSWEDVQNPQLSPDNKQIIYSRRWVDAVNDDWETSLWIMNSDAVCKYDGELMNSTHSSRQVLPDATQNSKN